ncbi:Short-chain dehydrogenase [hydrothermal vent metagenome]|uniref:Short-chain dehydrogenase n=1 Tax=hydrothermal vent metagenome TaxID=652676 RepID=A0A3B1DXJ1_9ZZZZ
MKSLWNKKDAEEFGNDLLKLRVYTSRLLGQESDLVLHGGGNTSVKIVEKDLFGDEQELLYVKGSGWDLGTIEAAGFAPVKQDVLIRMAQLEQLSDTDMVSVQRSAMTNPSAPNPSVEAILHAIIPFTFVDHTHADAVVTITNTPNGQERIKEIYGDKMLIIPYVMPGFILAQTVYRMTKDLDWMQCGGMILMNHGVFTFDNDAQKSYEKMIDVVNKAEVYVTNVGARHAAPLNNVEHSSVKDPLTLASIRQHVSKIKGEAMLAGLVDKNEQVHFSSLSNVEKIATRGPLTPDHVIRTKRVPMIIKKDTHKSAAKFVEDYEKYFKCNTTKGLKCLDKAPRWAVWPKQGLVAFGRSIKEVNIIQDITAHTIKAIEQAEILGRWEALPEKDIFEIEYWELEQAKLKKAQKALPFQGKIAIVTGAASGIGKACVEYLSAQGAVVAALDLNPDTKTMFSQKGILGLVCDVTNEEQIQAAIEATVCKFGGIDILVSNAGIFPQGKKIMDMDVATWDKSIFVNLSGHQWMLKYCIPYLELGIDPAVVIVGSKNVPAPGPGASAYSVAKAGLTQLARVAALELGAAGIRVNVVHPNQIFDTAIWTDEVLASRAKHYAMSVEDYKTNNLLKIEITSMDVAQMVGAMAGSVFSKTTGAQVPLDGGNERVI